MCHLLQSSLGASPTLEWSGQGLEQGNEGRVRMLESRGHAAEIVLWEVLVMELLHLREEITPPIFASATAVCIQTRSKEEIVYAEGAEALAQAAQRGGRCPIPGNIPGQAGRGSE